MNNSLSLCIINKDDKVNLVRLIKEALPWVHEIVVVDTGSKDDSMASARLAGAHIVADASDLLDEEGSLVSFSVARERSFKLASGRWLLWLDTDDTLDHWEFLPQLVEFAEEKRFLLGPGFHIRLPYDYSWNEDRTICTQTFYRERLVCKADEWFWKRPVHEYLDSKHYEDNFGKDNKTEKIRVIHLSQGARGGVNNRNLKILKRWHDNGGLEEEPNTINYYLGDEMLARFKYKEAINYFMKVNGGNWLAMAKYRIAVCLLNMHGPDKNTIRFIERTAKELPEYSNFHELLAFIKLRHKRFSKARKSFSISKKLKPIISESPLLRMQLKHQLGM